MDKWFIGLNNEFVGFDSKEEALEEAKIWSRDDWFDVEVYHGTFKAIVKAPCEPTVVWTN